MLVNFSAFTTVYRLCIANPWHCFTRFPALLVRSVSAKYCAAYSHDPCTRMTRTNHDERCSCPFHFITHEIMSACYIRDPFGTKECAPLLAVCSHGSGAHHWAGAFPLLSLYWGQSFIAGFWIQTQVAETVFLGNTGRLKA